MSNLDRLNARRRRGDEPFCDGDRFLGVDLLSFWQWSASDLVSNATRGVLAEYIVAVAVGAADGVRKEWMPYDILDPRGIRIEVKSAAFVQTWKQNRLSTISFAYPKTRAWDDATNTQSADRKRHADVYVFALLAHKDKASINPLDMAQWQFFVVPTIDLDRRKRSQHSITLPSLQQLAGDPIPYANLYTAIAEAAARHRASSEAVSGSSRGGLPPAPKLEG